MEHQYNIKPVKVFNQSISLINIDNVYYLPFKQLCEIAELEPSGQIQRIKRDELFNNGMVKITLHSKNGIQETLVLKLDLIINWLNGIKHNKITDTSKRIIQLMKEDINLIFEEISKEKELAYLRKEKARIEKRLKRDTLILNGLKQLELTYLKL